MSSTVTEIDYEVVNVETEDALYAVVLWPLPDGQYVMEVWDVAAGMCIDPGATTFKKVSTTGARITYKNRDRALATAGVLMSERDSER